MLVKVGARIGRLVWVDIACIDQENSADKMDEIGRQAAIFRKVKFAYIWFYAVPMVSLEAGANSFSEGPHSAKRRSHARKDSRL